MERKRLRAMMGSSSWVVTSDFGTSMPIKSQEESISSRRAARYGHDIACFTRSPPDDRPCLAVDLLASLEETIKMCRR